MAGAGLARLRILHSGHAHSHAGAERILAAGIVSTFANRPNLPVAWATTALVAIYPVYFTQSSMAQVDLPAAGFTFWALAAYIEDRPWKEVLWFSLAALAKETAILAPLALLGWEVLGYFIRPLSKESLKEIAGKKFFHLWADARTHFICCLLSCRWRAGTPTTTRRPASCWATPNSFATT